MLNTAPILAGLGGTDVSPVALVVGLLLPLLVQWLKNAPAVKFITPETIKTLVAVQALVAVGVGLAVAASQPGGLASVDWQNTIQVVSENAAVVWLATGNVYEHVIKPILKQKEKEASPLV